MNHQETVRQLGGAGKLKAMVGAYNFLADKDTLSFKFKGGKLNGKSCNYIKITLNSSDTYSLEFGYVRGLNYTTLKNYSTVYIDQLIGTFQKTTGLRLSL